MLNVLGAKQRLSTPTASARRPTRTMVIQLPVPVEAGVRRLVPGLDTAWARLVPRRMTARIALSARMGSVRTLDMVNETAAILCEQR